VKKPAYASSAWLRQACRRALRETANKLEWSEEDKEDNNTGEGNIVCNEE
jgi:hypothetical protein